MNEFASRVGLQEISRDYSDSGRMLRLAALLDHETPPWPAGVVPPLGHWLCFTPSERQSRMGTDGHPLRTDDGLLPNVDLPRRMWAGGRIEFRDDIPVDVPIERTSTLASLDHKEGRSGKLLLVTLKHEIGRVGCAPAIIEEQDILYREAADSSTPFVRTVVDVGERDQIIRSIKPDPVMLFRYSALTFNSHRIHYDREYARAEEGYPSLVIHGPLLATFLLDNLLRHVPGKRVLSFRFRAASPLLEGEQVELGLSLQDNRADLRAIGPVGVGMSATAEMAA